jgi:hypothetical protein
MSGVADCNAISLAKRLTSGSDHLSLIVSIAITASPMRRQEKIE